MNLSKAFLLRIFEFEFSQEDRALMEKACRENVFYVDAIAEMCGGYSIGSTYYKLPEGSVVDGVEGDSVTFPNLYPTLALAEEDVQSIINDYDEQIAAGERDEGDEYEGVVMRARITGDNEVSLYDVETNSLTWRGRIDHMMGEG